MIEHVGDRLLWFEVSRAAVVEEEAEFGLKELGEVVPGGAGVAAAVEADDEG